MSNLPGGMMNLKWMARLTMLVLLAALMTACASPTTPTPYPSPPLIQETQPVTYPLSPEQPIFVPTITYPDPNAPVTSDQPGGEASYLPQPGDENLTRGNVFPESASVLVMESFPPQYMLSVDGSLPTPCHLLRAEVAPPNAQNRIEVTLYSLVDPNAVCIQVIQPFSQGISLGSMEAGTYTVFLNGEEVETFDVQ